jgi:large repetitive protein
MGANRASKLLAKDELPTKSSYFLGSDPKKWRTGIPNYRRGQLENVYPGIDVMYEGTQGRLECHFLVAPAARPNRITIVISGARDPRLDVDGSLILRTEQTDLRLHRPTAYQGVGGNKRFVSARCVVHKNRVLTHVVILITVASELDHRGTVDPDVNSRANQNGPPPRG